ncbi:GTP 3',8-cyclase MoaA [uncultured Amnibacterium sp.]|uniref:GTP 3',8-cyclase MoaA n=1 Tax=uncultured Amnibacterium sp. TaxID=1631851 RepID=UPI0035CC9181
MTALNLTRQRPLADRSSSTPYPVDGPADAPVDGRPAEVLTAGRPARGLLDRFGRTATDLRISVTEKCSLRCTYCMPAEGLPAIPGSDLLTPAEIGRLVGIGVRELGVREVRFTGGEPLLRADLADIIAAARQAAPAVPLAITTNAVGLDRRLPALLAAGLSRVNVSLDTLDREHFARLTRRDRLPAVLTGIEAVQHAGLTPLKVNAVLMRETLADAPDLLAWSLQRGVRLRFIEQMPLDADGVWTRDGLVGAAELLALLERRFDLVPVGRDDPHAPAEEWRAVERTTTGTSTATPRSGTVGIIASVTRSFCVECDRTRLTAEGSVRACLFGDDETPLAPLLRGGAPDRVVADAWRAAMWGKQAGHGMDDADFRRPIRSMGAIGG